MNPPPPIAMNKSGPFVSLKVASEKERRRREGRTELLDNLDRSRLDGFMDIVVTQSDPAS
jgi:hypothetical protein